METHVCHLVTGGHVESGWLLGELSMNQINLLDQEITACNLLLSAAGQPSLRIICEDEIITKTFKSTIRASNDHYQWSSYLPRMKRTIADFWRLNDLPCCPTLWSI